MLRCLVVSTGLCVCVRAWCVCVCVCVNRLLAPGEEAFNRQQGDEKTVKNMFGNNKYNPRR